MNRISRKTILLLLLSLSVNISFGQVDTSGMLKRGKHKVFIKLINSEKKKKLKGYPIAITDSGIWSTTRLYPRKNEQGEMRYGFIFIPATNIERMHFRRKGSIGWGIIAGTIAGTIIGVAIASNYTEPGGSVLVNNLEEVAGGIIGLEAGAIIGGVIGGQIRRRFRIGGDVQNFLKVKEGMARYLP